MIHLVAFTPGGVDLCRRLGHLLEEGEAHGPARFAGDGVQPLSGPLREWTGERFRTGGALVFVCAAGIAVRAVAPFVEAKDRDPAVVCVSEDGRFAIPLLSGHMGGANRLAERIARLLGGTAVLTTATDVNGVFAVDSWAAEQGYSVMNPGAVKEISSALLEGNPVGLSSDFPVAGPLPEGITMSADAQQGIVISLEEQAPFARTLWLAPRCLVAGIGCRKGIPAGRLERFLLQLLEAHGLPAGGLAALASIELKREEPAILAVAGKYDLPFVTYPARELEQVAGAFAASDFVREVTGVDNVCERAAVLASGRLLVPKTSRDGMALAVGIRDWTVAFDTGNEAVDG